MDGWVGGCKSHLRIAYSNQKAKQDWLIPVLRSVEGFIYLKLVLELRHLG